MTGSSTSRGLQTLLQDRNVCKALLNRLESVLDGCQMRFMEVCGTHTVSLFQSGLRSLLPANILHLSGPGCPVCVTHDSEIAMCVELAQNRDVIIATFGDLLRVPGPGGQSLKHARAANGNIEIVYSPLDALELARKNPYREIIFLGIGFETTAPTVAAAIATAEQQKFKNFSVLSMHKLVPPALRALLEDEGENIQAFLLPGHVATVTGLRPFQFVTSEFKKPAAVGGFEPADLLLALCSLADQLKNGDPILANTYNRAVSPTGNEKAKEMMDKVFSPADALWRGLGLIPSSGLRISDQLAEFDAIKKFGLEAKNSPPPAGCLCGSVLKGKISPPDCPLFGKKCVPANPVGPCMVSTEGSCAAHFKYGNY